MTELEKAARQALEALEYAQTGNRRPEVIGTAITALRTAIEQAETAQAAVWEEGKPPVFGPPIGILMKLKGDETLKLYPLEQKPAPAAQPAEWVGLTEDELVEICPDNSTPMSLGEAFVMYARAIEAKLKEKNGGAA